MDRMLGATIVESENGNVVYQYELCKSETRCNLNNTDECLSCNHFQIVDFKEYAEDFIS